MTLMTLAARWAKAARASAPFVLTIDHGLRAESAGEARWVAARAKALGLKHATLRWTGAKPVHGVQEEARAARYRLIGAWARAHGVRDVLLGHTADDQAETFLMRLARGSGLKGLGGMAAMSALPQLAPEVRFLRPLLGFTRAQVAATATALGVKAVSDPSNDNPKFERVRVRAATRALADAGVGAMSVAVSAARLRDAQAALDAACAALLAGRARFSPLGAIRIDAALMRETPEALRPTMLRHVLRKVSGDAFAADEAGIARLAARLAAPGFAGATLNGCRFAPSAGRSLLITREHAAAMRAPLDLSPGGEGVWDGRFLVARGPGGPPALRVQALGLKAAASLRRANPLAAREPAAVLAVLPGFHAGERLIAVPSLAFTVSGSGAFARFLKAEPLFFVSNTAA